MKAVLNSCSCEAALCPMKITIPLAEALIGTAVLVCVTLSLWLEYQGAGRVAWAKFSTPYFYAGCLAVVGLAIRSWGRSERIAVTLIVTGLYIAFTNAGATLNYLFHPGGDETIDRALMQLDAWLGFDWLSYASWFADHEGWSVLMRVVYQTSLLQLLIVIVFLGASGRNYELHEFALVGVATSLVSILTWAAIPSFGPANAVVVPQELNESLRLVIGADYVNHLKEVSRGEFGIIEPGSLLGLIAFPSMHTVMALMVLYFTSGTRLFRFFLILNIPMAPAILLHGGHHLVDVIGGAVLFVVVLWPVREFLPRRKYMSEKPDILVPPEAFARLFQPRIK